MRSLLLPLAVSLLGSAISAQSAFVVQESTRPEAQLAFGTAGVWSIDETTTGGDVNWVSPTSVDPGAFAYDISLSVDTVEVTAVVLGLFPVTVDVTDDLDPELLSAVVNQAGPAPLSFLDLSFDAPGAPEPTAVAATLSFGLSATGFGFFDLVDVTLGTAVVPNPLGGGTISAPITALRVVASVEVDPAAWLDLGQGKPLPGEVEPLLRGGGDLLAGTPFSLDVSGAQASTPTFVIVGFSELSAPFMGGVLVPSPDIIKAFPPTNAAGELSILGTWPSGVPAGFLTYVQFWIDGTDPGSGGSFRSATNGIVGEAR